MFRDTNEELRRLEAELLADEQTVEDPQDKELLEEALLDALLQEDTKIADGDGVFLNHSNDYGNGLRNFASGYKAYNSDRVDEDPEELSQAILAPKKDGTKGLLITAIALSGAIVLALVWLLLRYLGVA